MTTEFGISDIPTQSVSELYHNDVVTHVICLNHSLKPTCRKLRIVLARDIVDECICICIGKQRIKEEVKRDYRLVPNLHTAH